MDSKTKQQTVQMGTGKITVSEITMCGVFAALTFLLTRYIQVQIIPAKGDGTSGRTYAADVWYVRRR